jgi:phenolic acid decarboxylase
LHVLYPLPRFPEREEFTDNSTTVIVFDKLGDDVIRVSWDDMEGYILDLEFLFHFHETLHGKGILPNGSIQEGREQAVQDQEGYLSLMEEMNIIDDFA